MHEHRTKVDSGAFGTNGLEGEYSPLREQAATESDRGRFCGTCETTLNDWIQLVQMGHRDAVVSVRTFDGREGTLWCREGDIVDADCDGVVGEPAVFRALAWQSGNVSVAFVPVTRHRLIQTGTAGLLLEEAYRRDSGIHDLGSLSAVPGRDSFDPGSDTTEISGPSDLIMQGQLASRSEWAAHGEDPDSYVPPDLRPSFSWPFALAGGVSVVLLFSLIAWKWVWPLPDRSAAARPSAPVILRHPPPAVDVPARARREVAAALPASALAATPSAPVRKVAPPRPAAYSSVLARRHTAPVAARRSAAISTSAPVLSLVAPASEGPKAAPLSRIEIIKDAPAVVSQPRVQIINEAAGHRQPRIEIIEDRKPRVDMVE